jgi:hypothetical protein
MMGEQKSEPRHSLARTELDNVKNNVCLSSYSGRNHGASIIYIES